MRIQTRKQVEKDWEKTFIVGVTSGLSIVLAHIAALKDHKKNPKLVKELEEVLKKALAFWGPEAMDKAVEQIDTWEENLWPEFLVNWKNNK